MKINNLIKRSCIMILICVVVSSCSINNTTNIAYIGFKEKMHDFGNVDINKNIYHTFEFSNIGKTSLIIYEVKTSYGCTVHEWPNKPILPGNKGFIKINYHATFPGVFHKTILVFYNGQEKPVELDMKGEVVYPEVINENGKK